MKLLNVIIFIFLATPGLKAQNSFFVPTSNPYSEIKQRIASTEIVVEYNRPSVKGRLVFGELVPYGTVWRTGSDATTKIFFSTPVIIEGNRLEAGKYEIFTIPEVNDWTIIFQKNKSQWGSYSYDQGNDKLRVKVNSIHSAEKTETFTITFSEVDSNSAILLLSWDKVQVPIQLEVDLEETVMPQIDSMLKAEGPKPYFHIAMFLFDNNLDIELAKELMLNALESNPDHIGMLFRLALIQRRLGDIEGARESSKKSLEGARNMNGILKDEYIRLNTEFMRSLSDE